MHTGVGVRVATFDETGALQARPWTPLGGPATRAPSVTPEFYGIGGIGALGTVDHAAWLGLQTASATRRLVAGIVRPTDSQVSPLAHPLDGASSSRPARSSAPAASPRPSSSRAFLGPPGSPDWGRLELVRVSAHWPDAVP